MENSCLFSQSRQSHIWVFRLWALSQKVLAIMKKILYFVWVWCVIIMFTLTPTPQIKELRALDPASSSQQSASPQPTYAERIALLNPIGSLHKPQPSLRGEIFARHIRRWKQKKWAQKAKDMAENVAETLQKSGEALWKKAKKALKKTLDKTRELG